MAQGSEAGSFEKLRQITDQLANSRKDSSSESSWQAKLSSNIPPTFSWQELAHELSRSQDPTSPQRVAALRACLAAEPSRLREDGKDSDAVEAAAAARRQIRNFAARVMAPIVGHTEEDEDDKEDKDEVIRRCRTVADDAVAVLKSVLESSREAGSVLSPSDREDTLVITSLIAAADIDQPWTTKTAAAAADSLLGQVTDSSNSSKADWIVDGLLNSYIRPLFSRTRPAGVTASGRKDAYGSSTAGRTMDTESPTAKPWKYSDLRALSVFAWTLNESDSSLLGRHWSLFTPVLLALVDDTDTDVRTRGLVLLHTFVCKLPDGGRLLHRTGLDSVLADAVLPTLLFLPRLTPEKESLQLLDPAYDALLALVGPQVDNTSPSLPAPSTAALLDRILREGVLAGYFHASEHIHVVAVLARQAGRVVEAMGLQAVKHLKDLLPLYAGILTDPFAMRYRPAVMAAVESLHMTLTQCWPRVGGTPWQEEVTRVLMLCWLNVEEDKDGETDVELKAGLVRAADTLLATMQAAHVDLETQLGPLVAKEPRLAGLFRIHR